MSHNEVKISIHHASLVTRLAYFIGPMEEIQSNRPSKNGSVVQRTNITSHLNIALLSFFSLSLSSNE